MTTLTATDTSVKPRSTGKPRKPYLATTPVTGTWRWAAQPTDKRTGQPRATAYLVHPVRDYGRLVGWRLEKPGGVVYDLAADLSTCDCPDGTYHPERPEGGCKHRKALRAALAALVS
jgi:hypothetical protein